MDIWIRVEFHTNAIRSICHSITSAAVRSYREIWLNVTIVRAQIPGTICEVRDTAETWSLRSGVTKMRQRTGCFYSIGALLVGE